nr:MAG TPA: hypothetical protein [Caudoviricetes sp.]
MKILQKIVKVEYLIGGHLEVCLNYFSLVKMQMIRIRISLS